MIISRECIIWQCELTWSKYSWSVTKNLTTGRLKNLGFGLYGRKAEIHSFPMMFIKGGSSFSRIQSKQGFSPKNCLKNRYFEYHDSGQTDFGGGWDPQFWKSWHFSHVPWKIWGISFQMRHWEACWHQYCPINDHNFFLKVLRKNANMCIFGLSLSGKLWLIDVAAHMRGTTMWKLTSWGFWKCVI